VVAKWLEIVKFSCALILCPYIGCWGSMLESGHVLSWLGIRDIADGIFLDRVSCVLLGVLALVMMVSI
jgi:hypothetical protein